MKRTIIAAAACCVALSAAACAPQGAPGLASSPLPDSDRASSSVSAPSPESASAHAVETTSPSQTESRGDDQATSTEAPTVAHGANDGTTAPESPRASASTPPTRSADGRARIGDRCPGLDGALRPAVNGETLVCAGGPIPRWTVILDEPAPDETTGQPAETTDEPTGDANDGDDPSSAPESTPDSTAPTQ